MREGEQFLLSFFVLEPPISPSIATVSAINLFKPAVRTRPSKNTKFSRNVERIISCLALTGIQNPDENIMSSKEFTNMGDPAPGFTAMVFGMPKMGKSYLCVDFANYLSLNHGKVLYVSKEEFMSPTLAIKLKDKGAANDNLDIAGSIPTDLSPYDFIFLDSVTSLKLTPEDLKYLEECLP